MINLVYFANESEKEKREKKDALHLSTVTSSSYLLCTLALSFSGGRGARRSAPTQPALGRSGHSPTSPPCTELELQRPPRVRDESVFYFTERNVIFLLYFPHML